MESAASSPEQPAELPQLELLPAVVGSVLAALPTRFVPSRCFLSACLELVISLVDAWLLAETSPAGASVRTAGAAEMQRRLAGPVGQLCAEAWWSDASEVADPDQGLRSSTSGLGGGSRDAAHKTLSDLMQRNAAAPARTHAVPGRSRFLFGAAWILCALEDIVGSVVVHTTRKAATVLSSRPTTAGGSRPLTARAATPGRKSPMPGSNREGAQTAVAAKTPSKATCAAAVAAEARLRLLALKHFVAAVKGDEGLRACPALESSLAEVATGVVPHVDARELLAVEAYRERLQQWTQQESEGGGAQAAEQAMQQALKTTVGTVASAGSAAPQSQRKRRSEVKVRIAVPPESPSTRPSTASIVRAQCCQWLPQEFVQQFNAEGEEVLEEASDDEEQTRLGGGGRRRIPAQRRSSSRTQQATRGAGAGAAAAEVPASGGAEGPEVCSAPLAAEPAVSRPISEAPPEQKKSSVPTIVAPPASRAAAAKAKASGSSAPSSCAAAAKKASVSSAPSSSAATAKKGGSAVAPADVVRPLSSRGTTPTTAVPAANAVVGGAGRRPTVGALLKSPAGRAMAIKLPGAAGGPAGYPAAKAGSRPTISELLGNDAKGGNAPRGDQKGGA